MIFLFTDIFYDVPPIWSQNQFDHGWLFDLFHHRWDLVNDELYTKFEKTLSNFSCTIKYLANSFICRLFFNMAANWNNTYGNRHFYCVFVLRYNFKIYLLLMFFDISNQFLTIWSKCYVVGLYKCWTFFTGKRENKKTKGNFWKFLIYYRQGFLIESALVLDRPSKKYRSH